jgi:hypothetical protein
MRQSITLTLDHALIGKLKTIAAEQQTSVSGLSRGELKRILERNERFRQARRGALADLNAGRSSPACVWQTLSPPTRPMSAHC